MGISDRTDKPAKGSVFDYLDDAVFVIDEPQLIEQTLSSFYENARSDIRRRSPRMTLLSSQRNCFSNRAS
jgi:hypothetical protein